jgi:deubiquitinase DESI2
VSIRHRNIAVGEGLYSCTSRLTASQNATASVGSGMHKGGGGVEHEVLLNVYDLHPQNDIMLTFGVGAFHTGIQVLGREYTFAANAGIFHHEPRHANHQFRESIVMGHFAGTGGSLDDIVRDLRPQFGSNDYNILTNNCNSFSDAFCRQLLNKDIPPWVNRLSLIGSFFSCLLPPSLTNGGSDNDGDSRADNNGTMSLHRRGGRSNQHPAASVVAFSGPGLRLSE